MQDILLHFTNDVSPGSQFPARRSEPNLTASDVMLQLFCQRNENVLMVLKRRRRSKIQMLGTILEQGRWLRLINYLVGVFDRPHQTDRQADWRENANLPNVSQNK